MSAAGENEIPVSHVDDLRVAALLASLTENSMLSAAQLERAGRAARSTGIRIDKALVDLGLLGEDVYLKAAASIVGTVVVGPAELSEAAQCKTDLLPDFLRHARTIPLRDDGETLTIVTSDPFDAFTPSAVAAKVGRKVVCVLARGRDLDRALERLSVRESISDTHAAATADVSRLNDLTGDAPVIRFVDDLLHTGLELHASDIHVTAAPDGSRVRFRVDGLLQPGNVPTMIAHEALISRIKILAGLDIAERRLPQDGHITRVASGREIDIRVATMPHALGEGAVLRILNRQTIDLDLASLGFSAWTETQFRQSLRKPHGIILVTGPTGSGKTTTLYSALRFIASPEINIITIEEPIEYVLGGIAQIQVNRKINFDFADALRSVLRQDPDIIMIGEIRDKETANVAIQAALTGHLVLATLHTNTAAGAITRLLDVGIEPFLLASTFEGALAQRLVRRACSICRGSGCPSCGGSGYRGRVAVTEWLESTDRLRELVRTASDEYELHRTAEQGGMVSMRADALHKVEAGLTTRQEVFRVLGGAP